MSLFVVVVTAFFLNKIGLPEFVKERLVEQIYTKGWEAEFSRVRLRWFRGIVADDLHLRRTNGLYGPNLFVRRAECGLNFRAFTRLELDVNSLKMSGGRLVWPMARRDQPQPAFTLNNVAGELFFKPNDDWELRFLRGELLGARLDLMGTITNGSLIRDWRIGETPRRPGRDPVALWEEIVRTAAQVRFGAQPEIQGTVRGDAADLRSFDANLKFKAADVASPWGAGTNLLLTARLFPGQAGVEFAQADLSLTAAQLVTRWVEASHVRMNLEVEPRYTNGWPTNANLALELKNAKTPWGLGNYALITTRLRLSPTNSSLAETEVKAMIKDFKDDRRSFASGDIKLVAAHPPTDWLPADVVIVADLSNTKTKWGDAARVHLKAEGNLPRKTHWSVLNTNLTWPDRLKALVFDFDVELFGVSGPGAEAERLAVQLDWHSPLLQVKSQGALYGGDVTAEAQLETETRDLAFHGHSTFDIHKITPLLGTNAQKFLKSYSWDSPPLLKAAGRLTLPPWWTNQPPDIVPELFSSLSLAGEFKVKAGAYKGITFSEAAAPFTFTNDVWRIENLALTRPEGGLLGTYTSYPASKEFHWKLQSGIDPQALRPLFTETVKREVFDPLEFTTPPLVEAEVWGHWRQPERVGMNAKVHGKNFKFRGESIGECSGAIQYTNFFLAILNPEIQRPGEKGVAPGIAIDFKRQRVWFTNAFGTLNPHAVARCVGRKTGEILEDYIFDTPPTTRVNGSVDFKKGSDEDDLHFEISGGTFHWKDFHFQQLAGNINWIGRTMVLTNMQGIFHGGRAAGQAHFAFPRKRGAEFSFKIAAAEVDFHSFMSDLISKTNNLEGMLNGELTVVSGNTERPNSWVGYGNVHLRDGVIWDIPVFGLFSPILNTIVPGSGNSRAKQGVADFLITNSVISTTDLDIQATGMRMHFQGTVDFERRIDSRVEAELLRDLPGIGLLISKILWPVSKLFEYRVTGTLSEPKAEPLYIVPKILLLPLQPFKVLKDLVTEEPKPNPPKAPD